MPGPRQLHLVVLRPSPALYRPTSYDERRAEVAGTSFIRSTRRICPSGSASGLKAAPKTQELKGRGSPRSGSIRMRVAARALPAQAAQAAALNTRSVDAL